jgi:sugar lactone lactonase YvrE
MRAPLRFSVLVLVAGCDHAAAPPPPSAPAPTPAAAAPATPAPAPPAAPPRAPADSAIVLADHQNGPTKLALTATDVVWLNEIGGQVMKVAKAGGAVVELARRQEVPLGIAVDADRAYWTTRTGNGDSDSLTDPHPTGGVWSVALAGGAAPAALAAKRAYPDPIAVDAGRVYFGERGLTAGKGGQLARVAAAGGAVAAIHAGAPGGIVVAGDRLYWSVGGTCESVNGAPMPDDGAIWSSPIQPLAPTLLAGKLRCPEGIAVDADAVYVADMDDGTILRVPKAGGAPAVAATDDARGPRYVAVDATSVYWLNQGTGKLRRRGKSGGAVETLLTLKDPAGIAVDDHDIYVTDSELGTVRKLAK